MLIDGKVAWVYDVEVFSNCFSCVVKDTESNTVYIYEISKRKNDIQKIINLFYCIENRKHVLQDRIFVGYNNIHFDNVLINYLLYYREAATLVPYDKICSKLKEIAEDIIHSDEFPKKWSRFKYTYFYDTLDLLTMMFSSKLRVGLKEMQVTMQFPNVQEYAGDFSKPLPEDKIDEMLSYNINDVESTTELLNRLRKDIDLRLGIKEEYGIDVLNKDGVNIGMEILKQKYLEKTHQTYNDIKDLRSPCDVIDMQRIILPFVEFKTPVLKNLLNDLRTKKISAGRDSLKIQFLLNNVEHTMGVGGLHSVNKPEAVFESDEYALEDWDVALA
jgi:hypothetical protein